LRQASGELITKVPGPGKQVRLEYGQGVFPRVHFPDSMVNRINFCWMVGVIVNKNQFGSPDPVRKPPVDPLKGLQGFRKAIQGWAGLYRHGKSH